MDYNELAKEFIQNMMLMRKARPQKNINEGMQGEAYVLHFIKERQDCGDIVPSDISGAMGVSTARVATALNSLEGKGLITREIDKNDRRRILVKLTEKGCEFEKEQENKITQVIVDMLKGLGEFDAKEYIRITGRLAVLFSKRSE